MIERGIGRPRTAVAGALALAVVVTAGADWPQFRGPGRDGLSPETGLLESWPAGGPPALWRVPLGEGYSSVSVADGRLYTLYAKGEDEFVVCLDALDGKTLWQQRLDDKWVDRFGNGPRSTPTVHAGVVYALGARGVLVALEAASGKRRWSKDLDREYGASPPQWGVATSPLVEGDRLLVNVGGKDASIVAFDLATGEEAWRSQSDGAGYSAPLPITVHGERQVLVFTANRLVAVTPGDGALRWSVPWKTSYDVNASTPVFLPPDRVFVSSGYDVGGALYRIERTEGGMRPVELWKTREMKTTFSSPVLHDGHLYGFDDKTLRCLDAATGTTLWRQRGFGHGSLIAAGGRLIVLGDAGQLALVDATPEAYRERASVRIFESKTWTPPTLAGGRLYLRDESQLVALDLTGGAAAQENRP